MGGMSYCNLGTAVEQGRQTHCMERPELAVKVVQLCIILLLERVCILPPTASGLPAACLEVSSLVPTGLDCSTPPEQLLRTSSLR